jgi:hypothetical protein
MGAEDPASSNEFWYAGIINEVITRLASFWSRECSFSEYGQMLEILTLTGADPRQFLYAD